jgi:hypothetical protein
MGDQNRWRLHHIPEGRFLLEEIQTRAFMGMLFRNYPGESRRNFEYNFGSAYSPEALTNWKDFPELADLEFFTVEYPSSWDIQTHLNNPTCAFLHGWLRAEYKALAYGEGKGPPNDLPQWCHTTPNPAGSWALPIWAAAAQGDTLVTVNRDGLVLAFNAAGEIVNQQQLPALSRAMQGDDRVLLALCDDGQLYALDGKLPQVAYSMRPPDRPWQHQFFLFGLDVTREHIHLGDCCGHLVQLDRHYQRQWERDTPYGRSWFLASDSTALYQGHCEGVTAYDLADGELLWHQPTPSPILCGALTEDYLWLGSSNGEIYAISKRPDWKPTIAHTIPWEGVIYSLTLAGDWLYTGNHQGTIAAWKLQADQSPPLVKQGQKSSDRQGILTINRVGDGLYTTTTLGSVCRWPLADFHRPSPATPPVTNSAVSSPERPKSATTKSATTKSATTKSATTKATPTKATQKKPPSPSTKPPPVPATDSPISASKSGPADSEGIEGILVECVKQGKQIRVRVLSPGYRPDWFVQFPRHLRQEGAQYWVQGIRENPQGGFYRAYGEIRPWENPSQ